ncbi:hypothetical protein GCM10008904_31870 [Paraclostridium ghonii]
MSNDNYGDLNIIIIDYMITFHLFRQLLINIMTYKIHIIIVKFLIN